MKKENRLQIRNSTAEFLIFTRQAGEDGIEVRVEIARDSTIRNFRIVQIEGEREVARNVEFYNLDAIIAVGFRVNSTRAIQFRQWATGVLRDYAIRGYVLDKERLEFVSDCHSPLLWASQ